MRKTKIAKTRYSYENDVPIRTLKVKSKGNTFLLVENHGIVRPSPVRFEIKGKTKSFIAVIINVPRQGETFDTLLVDGHWLPVLVDGCLDDLRSLVDFPCDIYQKEEK